MTHILSEADVAAECFTQPGAHERAAQRLLGELEGHASTRNMPGIESAMGYGSASLVDPSKLDETNDFDIYARYRDGAPLGMFRAIDRVVQAIEAEEHVAVDLHMVSEVDIVEGRDRLFRDRLSALHLQRARIFGRHILNDPTRGLESILTRPRSTRLTEAIDELRDYVAEKRQRLAVIHAPGRTDMKTVERDKDVAGNVGRKLLDVCALRGIVDLAIDVKSPPLSRIEVHRQLATLPVRDPEWHTALSRLLELHEEYLAVAHKARTNILSAPEYGQWLTQWMPEAMENARDFVFLTSRAINQLFPSRRIYQTLR